MLEPLKQFICDTCSTVIEKPEDGWVEWLSYVDESQGKIINKSFRVCHHKLKCMKFANHIHSSDGHLHSKLEDNIFVNELFCMLDPGPNVRHEHYKGPEVESIPETVEMIRRFSIPFYEEARKYFPEAKSEGYVENFNDPYFYRESNLKSIIEEFSR